MYGTRPARWSNSLRIALSALVGDEVRNDSAD
jgi:hypothetical protein